MPNYSSSPLERVFVGPQTVFRTIPNGSGTWTQTGVKLIPHNRVQFTPGNELVPAGFKTGTTGSMAGHLGRKGPGGWTLEAPIRPSGAAGTAPDMDMLLAGAFGAIGTVVAATSVTYNWTDAAYFFLLAAFNRTASTNTQRWAWGSIVTELSLNLGSGDLIASFSGKNGYVMLSDNFANEDSVAKAGLTVALTEPTSPSIVGANVLAYGGSVTFGGSAVAEFQSANIVISTGRDLASVYQDQYPLAPVLGRHQIMLRSLRCLDSDGAALTTVKNAALNKTAMDVVVPVGTTAGYIITHTLKQVQFGNATITENGAEFDVEFGDSPAHVSGIGNLDDYKMVLT